VAAVSLLMKCFLVIPGHAEGVNPESSFIEIFLRLDSGSPLRGVPE